MPRTAKILGVVAAAALAVTPDLQQKLPLLVNFKIWASLSRYR